jgi:hypothetical protein
MPTQPFTKDETVRGWIGRETPHRQLCMGRSLHDTTSAVSGWTVMALDGCTTEDTFFYSASVFMGLLLP